MHLQWAKNTYITIYLKEGNLCRVVMEDKTEKVRVHLVHKGEHEFDAGRIQ